MQPEFGKLSEDRPDYDAGKVSLLAQRSQRLEEIASRRVRSINFLDSNAALRSLGFVGEPTQSQERKARALLPETTNIISQLSSIIKDVQSTLQQLHDDRQAVHALLSQQKAVLAPIRRLPPEIMSHIFDLHISRNSEYKNYTELLKITFVCSRWRQIALTTCDLWTSFSLERKYRYSHFINQLKRSKSSLLDVSIGECHGGSRKRIEQLMAVSDRWRSFEFYPHPEPPKNLKLESLKGRLSNLKYLRVRSYRAPHDPPFILDFAEVAPNLTKIESRWPLSSFRLPWAQLSDISFSYQHLREAYYVVSMCPNVSCLRLHKDSPCYDSEPNKVNDAQTFTLPRLRQFTLSHNFYNDPATLAILGNITAPALQKLHLIGGSTYPIVVDPFVLAFFSRSPSLRILVLELTRVLNLADIYLQAMPGLKILHIWKLQFFYCRCYSASYTGWWQSGVWGTPSNESSYDHALWYVIRGA